MLATGGRLVYSTCSFNPIENEAVVQAVLKKFGSKISLVDVSKEVSPHLKYRPGFISWKVFHRGKGKKEAPAWHMAWESVPDWKRSVLRQTMFHDTYTYHNNQPLCMPDDPLNLRRCMRFMPQDDNQGGFFVAVFAKTADIGRGGTALDRTLTKNAWEDKSVR